MTLGAIATMTPESEGLRKTYRLGYKLHLAVDSGPELPIVHKVAPANENEKKHTSSLIGKAMETTDGKVRVLVADFQY
jgi:IS5 family transposase